MIRTRRTAVPSRRAQVKDATGKEAESIELNAQELEERIAPRTPSIGFDV